MNPRPEQRVIVLYFSFVLYSFMGRGVVDLPIEQVVEFLEDHERRKEWDKYLSVSLLPVGLGLVHYTCNYCTVIHV